MASNHISFKFIDYNDKKLIDDCQQVRSKENPIYGNMHYTSNYLYNALNNNHNNIIGKVQIDSDEIIILVRKVSLGKAQYNRCSEYPISLNGIKTNEDYMFEMLFKNEYIEQAYIPEYYLNRINKTEFTIDKNPSDYNFYSSVENDLNRFTNKFKTHYRITMMEKNTDFKVRKLLYQDFPSLHQLYNRWSNSKENLHNKVLFKNYLSQFSYWINYENLIQYCITYKEEIIALVSFAVTNPNYCYKLIQWTYRREPNMEEILDKIISQIGQILHYEYTIKLSEIGVKYVSCAGSASGGSGLINHKNETMRNKISYYKVTPKNNNI